MPVTDNDCVEADPFCIVAENIVFGGGVSIEAGIDDDPFCKNAIAADVSPKIYNAMIYTNAI